MCSLASRTLPAPLTLEFRVHGPAGRAGLTRWIEAICHCDSAVMPLALVDQLALDLAHAGVGLCLRRPAFHHAHYVQIFDHEGLILSDQARGHLVLRVATQSHDAPLEPVLTPLRFPPAPTARRPARLRPLPSLQLALSQVIRLRVLPGLCLGVSSVRVDARVDCANGYALVRCRRRYGRLPILQAQISASVLTLDVRLVQDSLRKRVCKLYGADPRQTYSALTIESYLHDA